MYGETSVEAPEDYLDADLCMPGVRLMQYSLSDHIVANHRWCYFQKMLMEEVLLFKRFDPDAGAPWQDERVVASRGTEFNLKSSSEMSQRGCGGKKSGKVIETFDDDANFGRRQE